MLCRMSENVWWVVDKDVSVRQESEIHRKGINPIQRIATALGLFLDFMVAEEVNEYF